MKNKLTFVMALIGILAAPLAAQAQSKKPSTTKKPESSATKAKAKEKEKTKAATKAKTTSPAHLTPATEKEKAAAKKEAAKLTATQSFKLLDILNKGDKEAIVALPSIGESRAANVIKARPFKNVEDLIDVTGIGAKGLSEIIAHGKTLPQRTTTTKKASDSSSKKPTATKKP